MTEARQALCFREKLLDRSLGQAESCDGDQVERFDRARSEAHPLCADVQKASAAEPRCERLLLMRASEHVEVARPRWRRADDEHVVLEKLVERSRELDCLRFGW